MDMTPENPPAPPPKPPESPGFWSKVFSLTPVLLTIVATTLAGISSSELTQSMYYRSVAAQNQSKAGDQWSFFQVKRVRGTTLESTVELMHSLGASEPLSLDELGLLHRELLQLVQSIPRDRFSKAGVTTQHDAFVQSLQKLSDLLTDPASKRHLGTVFGGPFPKLTPSHLSSDESKKQEEMKLHEEWIEEVRKAIGQRKTESETKAQVGKIKHEHLEAVTQLSLQDADEFDRLCAPLSETVNRLRQLANDFSRLLRPMRRVTELDTAGFKEKLDQLTIGLRMAVTDFNARRYREESRLNQRVAELFEVRVRRSGFESDRHRERSTLFFYAMIAAQAGVTISSLAMARSKKSTLWLIATIAGLASIAFATWVYLMQ